MKKKLIITLFVLCLLIGISYYISLPDYRIFNSISYSNQDTRETTLKVVVYKYWEINDTIKKSKKNTTKLMVHLPHLKLIFIIQNCLSDMEKSLLKQSCLNITRKRGRQHYTNCIVFLLIWFFASSIFLKQKNKRNAVKSTFLPLLSTAADRNRTGTGV